ncbi:hypothetical protein WMF37_34255 [Sorangium sp. So ce291]|uniref:hypothetical protein n=1 Tax=Sorangium sp. So ce291 TaxID=3133294 RepID=UPI003F606C1C
MKLARRSPERRPEPLLDSRPRATAALFTCMMDWIDRESAATDYTIQASAVVIATGVASAASGFSAGRLGYPLHFSLAAALAALSPMAALLLFPGRRRPAEARARAGHARRVTSHHVSVYAMR